MKKKLCVLQVAPSEPNPDHIEYFKNKEDCDFYFVTHDDEHQDAMQFCPNTTWVDTRNILAKNVPKEYEYYAFVDYDYVFRPQRKLNVLEQILEDLCDFNPAVLTYYPGNGLITPYASNVEYYESFEHSVIPFTHCGLKIVHHSLMKWFFPMVTRFGGGVDACHLFNILEIPFLKNVVCSHKMKYDNGVTDFETPHNKSGYISKMNMDKMWQWILPAFKKSEMLKIKYGNTDYKDSLSVKNFFISVFKDSNILPQKEQADINYFSKERVEKFFDLEHEWFYGIKQK